MSDIYTYISIHLINHKKIEGHNKKSQKYLFIGIFLFFSIGEALTQLLEGTGPLWEFSANKFSLKTSGFSSGHCSEIFKATGNHVVQRVELGFKICTLTTELLLHY